MARVGRGQPQSFTSIYQSHLRGPFRPAPVVLIPSVELALRTIKVDTVAVPDRLVRATRRGSRSIPASPIVIFGLPPARPISVSLTAVKSSVRSPMRGRIGVIGAPIVVVPPPLARPTQIWLAVNASRRSPLRRSRSRLAPPAVLAPPVFSGPATTLAVKSRRYRPKVYSIPAAPVVINPRLFQTPLTVALVRTRPRRRTILLGAPVVTLIPAVTRLIGGQTSIRPRRRTIVLGPPVVTARQVVIGPQVQLFKRTRPPRTHSSLPVVVVPAAAQVFYGPSVHQPLQAIGRYRRKPFSSQLNPPTVLQTFAGPTVALTHIRPRRTAHALGPLVFYAQTSVVGVKTVRVRPRHTIARLAPPVFYAQTTRISVALTHTRPRPTSRRLSSVSYPATSALRVALVRTRPRHTFSIPAAPVVVFTGALAPAITARTVVARPRRTLLRLYAPAVVSSAQAFYGPTVHTVKTRSRPTSKHLAPPTVLQTFGPPVEVEVAVKIPLERVRQAPHSRLSPPIFYAQTSVIQTHLVRIRPRRTSYALHPPTALQVFGPPVEEEVAVRLAEQRPRVATHYRLYSPVFIAATSSITVRLVRTRPRPTAHELTAVTYAASSQILAKLVRVRPRPTVIRLSAVVYAATSSIRVTLARVRPRHTVYRLSPPTVTQIFGPPEEVEVAVKLAIRPRIGTHYRLSPPTALQVFTGVPSTLVRIRPRRRTAYLGRPITIFSVSFFGPVVTLTHTRPRHIASVVRPPTVVAPATAVTYAVSVHQVRTRPPRTSYRLSSVVYAAISSIEVKLVRTRPRPTVHALTAVSYAATSQIRTTLVRARPRHTFTRLVPPTTLQVFGPPVEVEIAVRTPPLRLRELPHSRLAPPVFIAATSTIKAALVRVRPPRKAARLAPPIVLQVFGPPVEVEVDVKTPIQRFRQQPHSRLSPPVFYAQTSTIKVALVRTRPRPTEHRLAAISYAATSEIQVTLVRIRPRRTTATLRVPQTLQVFAAARVTLVRTRPRTTAYVLRLPTVVIRTPVDTTIAVALVRTRPRHTDYRLAPPATLEPFIVELREETILVKLVRTRPRPTTKLLRPPTVVHVPSVEQREETITILLARTRPPRTHASLTNVSYAATSRISVTLVRIRPQPTVARVEPPTVTATFTGPIVTVVKTRPRPTTRLLLPPQVVEVPSVKQREETITVALVRIRPPFRRALLQPPTVLAVFSGPEVALTRTRPRPTSHFLNPPTVVRVPSVEQAEDTIRVALIHIRPRPTAKFLQPGIVRPFISANVLVTQVVTRPRHTRYLLGPPTVVRVPAVDQALRTIGTHLTRTRPRPTTRLLRPPTVVTTPQPVLYPIKVVIPREPPRPIPHSHIFPIPPVPPAPPITTASGGAYRRYKPRLWTAEDVRRFLDKHDGILVKERLTEQELRMMEEWKLTGLITSDELTEEEEIEVLRILGWL